MNNQYPQYQAPAYAFAPNPYTTPYPFQAPPQHQQPQPQLQQHLQRPHQSQQYIHNFAAPPQPRVSEGPPPQTNPPPPPVSRPTQKRRGPPPRSQVNRAKAVSSRRNGVAPRLESPENGPGAPPPEPTTPDDNIEEELMNALQSDSQSRPPRGGREDDDDDDDQDQDGEADENDPVFPLPPPPEGNYASEKELEEQMHAWTLDHGYECVRRASKKNARGVVYKRYYHCSRHGKTASTGRLDDSTRKRAKRKTGRLGCPMSLAAVAVDPTNPEGEWEIRHRKTHHNHAAEDAVTLTGHRRRARGGDVERVIDSLFSIGTPTTQVLKFLQKNHPGGLFTRTDVANMKLKFNKYGTCVKDGLPERSVTAGKGGVPSACQRCRQKRVKCNSLRPVCGTCASDGEPCEYDHEPQLNVNLTSQSPLDVDVPMIPEGTQGVPHQQQQQQQQNQQLLPPPESQPNRRRRGPQPPRSEEDIERAQRVMSEFQAFQADHVRPTRLTLESSVVESLASSSCGSGDLYKSVSSLTCAADWPTYCNLMIEASMKENTYDVLIGAKPEPSPPPSDCEVEAWNEYIKQFAIYKRRNDMLLACIWTTLTPGFKTRVANCKSAAQAWNLVEDMCQPRGSDQVFKLYADLQNVTLPNSRDLNDYIQRLEQAYTDLMRAKMHNQQAQDSIGILSGPGRSARDSASHKGSSSTPANSAKKNSRVLGDPMDVFPEESLCFLFLTNLGPAYRAWAETVCATSNVGGFGTGMKVGFRELSRKAVEWDSSRRRAGANNNVGYARM